MSPDEKIRVLFGGVYPIGLVPFGGISCVDFYLLISIVQMLTNPHNTGVHSNQDHIWLVKIGYYIGFYVDRRSRLLWSPVIVHGVL